MKLFCLAGSSTRAVTNIICSHFIINKFKINEITVFTGKGLMEKLREELVIELNSGLTKICRMKKHKEFNNCREHDINPIFKQINTERLEGILDDISHNLPNDNFIIDITAGRKIMSVAASLAFMRNSQTGDNSTYMSYYLLKTSSTEFFKDKTIFQLLEDEWELQFYRAEGETIKLLS